MPTSPKQILVVLGIVLAVVSLIWPNNYILSTAVLLLGVAYLVP